MEVSPNSVCSKLLSMSQNPSCSLENLLYRYCLPNVTLNEVCTILCTAAVLSIPYSICLGYPICILHATMGVNINRLNYLLMNMDFECKHKRKSQNCNHLHVNTTTKRIKPYNKPKHYILILATIACCSQGTLYTYIQ